MIYVPHLLFESSANLLLIYYNYKTEKPRRFHRIGLKLFPYITTFKALEIIKNSTLKCSCSHLTSFAGGFLVPPNQINFEQVYHEVTSPEEPGKFLVLGTVVTCFLVYLVVVLLARRADIKDSSVVRYLHPPFT